MIKSLELEKRVLAGLLNNQQKWGEVAQLVNEGDFFHPAHASIFKIIRAALNNQEKIDDVIIIGRLEQLQASFPDGIDITEYIRSLQFFPTTEDLFISSLKELKRITLRRNLWDSSQKIQKYLSNAKNEKYSDILQHVDTIYNDTIETFELGDDKVSNLSELAESLIEGLGDNPPENNGIMSPYETINKIYGSIFKAGNIACVAARSGVGKTTVLIDAVIKTSYSNNCLPIIHFDNGEMSEEEITFRMVSSISGIPQYMLEDGSWRCRSYGDLTPEEVVSRVRSAWPIVKRTKILYYNVAGMTSEEMCSLLKRIYYNHVGRGNEAIFSFDYLKTDFKNLDKGNNWAFVGKILDAFKQVITKDLTFDKKPVVAMLTSVQLNRSGITTNRNSNTIQDTETEDAISLSDHIIQFCSHFFLLRFKILEERGEWGDQFGTHNLICLKARHLGEELFAHINPIEMPDGTTRRNFINLEIKNFGVKDCGDLRSIVAYLNNQDVSLNQSDGDNLPI